MAEFIKVLLSLSLSGTLLLHLLSLLRPLYRERFSRRWQYYIWLAAALRFIVPFTPDTAFTGYLFDRLGTTLSASGNPASGIHGETRAARDDIRAIDEIQENADSDIGYSAISTTGIENGFTGFSSITNAGSTLPDSPGYQDGIDFPHRDTALPVLSICLFWIWLAVTVILFARKITIYRNFLSSLKAGRMQVSDSRILEQLTECRTRLNIRKTIPLYSSPLIASPLLTGFFRPCIFLPSEAVPEYNGIPETAQLSAKEADFARRERLWYVFTHELIHYKRRDMFYKWFIQTVCCIHWFNPFVCRLAKETGRDCELACDEAVTDGLAAEEKAAYGSLLLCFLRTEQVCGTALVSMTLTESAEELKERLSFIIKPCIKSWKTTLLTFLTTTVICLCFAALGAYAQSGSGVSGEQISISGQGKGTADTPVPETAPTAQDKEPAMESSPVYGGGSAAVPDSVSDNSEVWDKVSIETIEVVTKQYHQCTICGSKCSLYQVADVYGYRHKKTGVWSGKKERGELYGPVYSTHPCYEPSKYKNLPKWLLPADLI